MDRTDGPADPVLGCVLALVAAPFLFIGWLLALPTKVAVTRALAAGKVRCPDCRAEVPTDGRATCPTCNATSFGSLLSCRCGWTTDTLTCPNCRATVFVEEAARHV